MNKMIVRLQGAAIYQEDSLILQEVQLRINEGEFTYLIGKTGSGKSSLLKTIYAALPLREGKGEVAGYDLRKLNRRTIPLLRRKLGIVFQDFNLLTDRSVLANLQFVLRATGWKDAAKRQERIAEVLQQVGLAGQENKLPHQLSGGEQQRVVIARALLNSPALILADEPTGNLDPETSDDILLLLREVSKRNNAAVLFATHDYRILENFPARIIRCVNGRIHDDQELEVGNS
ncbi:MAG: ATP-binding cassette domain-containing protein [Lewinellaceae bacterium]|nr:ATP-binding cassette domain-containing protein [Lewinellaceae bacterium]